jgi:hypothetical protein
MSLNPSDEKGIPVEDQFRAPRETLAAHRAGR